MIYRYTQWPCSHVQSYPVLYKKTNSTFFNQMNGTKNHIQRYPTLTTALLDLATYKNNAASYWISKRTAWTQFLKVHRYSNFLLCTYSIRTISNLLFCIYVQRLIVLVLPMKCSIFSLQLSFCDIFSCHTHVKCSINSIDWSRAMETKTKKWRT